MIKYVAVAGATGYTGKRIVQMTANHAPWRSRALVRSNKGTGQFPAGQDVVQCQLDDVASLTKALEGCNAVIQTIGTTRAQFAPGVSYETVDYGTTVALIQAAQNVGIKRFVLLSSVGAGSPVGSYLQWKARTEQAVQASGLDWVIARPSAIVGEGRQLMALASAPLKIVSKLPVVSGFGLRYQAIDVHDLARCLVNALDITPKQILEGRSLWDVVGSKQ